VPTVAESTFGFSRCGPPCHATIQNRTPLRSLLDTVEQAFRPANRTTRCGSLASKVLTPATYLALEKSSTTNNWPLRSTMPMPITFMSVSNMFAWCLGDFTNWAWINEVLGP
jgi:hypothetical protein